MPVQNYIPRYDVESPFRSTPVIGNFMAYYIHRSIDPQPDDILVVMDNPKFVERPDLLAHEMYGKSDLWWVFGVRNGLEDPVYDIQLNISLFIPNPDYVRRVL